MATFTAAVLIGILYTVTAYPTGAPEEACDTFRPNHLHHHSRQPFQAQNEDDLQLECPYDVLFSSPFTPGQPITLNITVKNHTDHFQGYILAVVEDDDRDGVEAQGQFGPNNKAICGGTAVTQSVGGHKKSEVIEWIAPADSSKKTFEIWMTVVRSFSKFWVNCSPKLLPAIDADRQDVSGIDFEMPTENVHADKNSTDTSIFKNNNKNSNSQDIDNMNKKDMSSSSMVSSSSMIESEENPNSKGDDDSGDSIENSVDVSDNRSGSSLNSEEKEQKRQQYFNEGIENFDSDIKKFLVAVDKLGVYEQFKAGQFKSGASAASALSALVVMAAAMLTLA